MQIIRPRAVSKGNKYCPGCGHGIINRLISEVLEELGMDGDALAAIAVGCSSLMPDTFEIDCVQAQHGRAAAVAVGMKACRPDKLVFTYQGDGDALAIGIAETLYAAIRNDPITVFFVNNSNFGMTGGQMAPTTLSGQKTTTSPMGRDCSLTGEPLDAIALLTPLKPAYLARAGLYSPAEIVRCKKFIRTAFETQIMKKGYSFVEILSTCPTNWKSSPRNSMEHVKNTVANVFPLGEFIKGE